MVGTATDNISLAKKAWSWLETESSERTITDLQPYFDLLADDVVLKVEAPEDASGLYLGEVRGKQALIDMYTAALNGEGIEENDLERPLEFVGKGERVVVLGSERYKIKKDGVTARNKEFALVMDFRDGKITRVQQIGDLSEYVAAMNT